MNTPKSTLTLMLLGFATFVAAPASSFAQEEQGKESTQGVEVGEATGTVEKIEQASDEAGEKATDKDGKKNKKSKASKEQRQMMKDVAAEMGRYRANTARLKQARNVGEKKNDAALIKKADELAPKLDASHKAAMAELRAKYGEKEVNGAMERMNKQSRSDIKKHDKHAKKAKSEGTQQAKEVKDKGKKKKNAGKGKKEGSDS